MVPDREELAKLIDVAEWEWIKPHTERGMVIVVDSSLDLADVAYSIASDDKPTVERFLMNKLIKKPLNSDIDEWNSCKKSLFSMIVISPFVLVQEAGN